MGGELSMAKSESICTFTEDFNVQELRLYEQSYFKNGSEVNFLTKSRIHHGLLYLKSCSLEVHLPSGEVLHAQRGDLLYLPRGSRYRSVFHDVTDRVPSILFNCDISLNGKDFPLSKSVELIRFSDKEALKALFDKARGAKYSPLMLKSCFFSILELWYRKKSTLPPTRVKEYSVISPALEYIEAHENEEISIEALAKICHLSPSFFRKKFSRITGSSPKDFYLARRLERAKSLLESGEFTVGEVSALLGFSSPSYFSRIFSRKIGMRAVDCLKK